MKTKHKVVLTEAEVFDAIGAYVLKKMGLRSLQTFRISLNGSNGELTFEFTDTSNKA